MARVRVGRAVTCNAVSRLASNSPPGNEPATVLLEANVMTHQQSRPARFRGGHVTVLACSLLLVTSGVASSQGNSPEQLREFIGRQVGGAQKLQVPARDADIPQPRLADGSPDPRFKITEAKRYLGKQLFHDPIRTARILPEFDGVLATKQTASCASCHMGEASSKAGG